MTIEAIPLEGHVFSHGSGDLTGNENPTVIVMGRDKTITAHSVEDGGNEEVRQLIIGALEDLANASTGLEEALALLP